MDMLWNACLTQSSSDYQEASVELKVSDDARDAAC